MDRNSTMSCKKVISVNILGILECSNITCFFFTMDCSAAGTTIYVDDSNVACPWNGTQLYPFQHINDGASSQASTLVDITQVSSQGDTPSGNNEFALTIPFPVIIFAMIVSMIVIFAMFIRWMKKR